MLFYLAGLFERWSEWCAEKAWAWEARRLSKLPPGPFDELLRTAITARLPEIVANITKSNPLLEKLRGKK